MANTPNHGLKKKPTSEPWNERLGLIEKKRRLTDDNGFGTNAVYLLKAVERYGVELPFEKLGVEAIHVGFEARYVHFSAILSLHFVPEMKDRARDAAD